MGTRRFTTAIVTTLTILTAGLTLTTTAAQAAPELFTGGTSGLETSGVTVHGEINPAGVESSGFFEYGQCPTSPCVSGVGGYTARTVPVPIGSGTSNVKVEVTLLGLEAGRSYRYRPVVESSIGQTAGSEGQVTLPGGIAPVSVVSVTSGGVTGVTQSAATITGSVEPQGAEVMWGVEVGAQGGHVETLVGGTFPAGTTGTQPVALILSRLVGGVVYDYRVYATSDAGTVYGAEASFATQGYVNPLSIPLAPPLVATPSIAFPTEAAGKVVKEKTPTKKKAKKKAKGKKKPKHNKKR